MTDEQRSSLERSFTDGIKATSFLSVVKSTVYDTKVTALCRLSPVGKTWDGERGLIAHLLRNEGDWTSFIGKQYILRGSERNTGALAYGWRISITSDNLARAVDDFCGLIYEFVGQADGPQRSDEKLEVIHSESGTETLIPMRSSERRNLPTGSEKGMNLGGATALRR